MVKSFKEKHLAAIEQFKSLYGGNVLKRKYSLDYDL